MPKDYAKKMISARRRQHQKDRSVLHAAVAVIVAFCLIAVLVYALHVYRQSGFFSKMHVAGWVDSAKAMVSRKGNVSARKVKSPPASPMDDIQFDFYTELPNVQVNLPETTELKPAPMAAPARQLGNSIMQVDDSIKMAMAKKAVNTLPKQVVQYVVEVGEFKDPVSASQLRLSLLLAGVETEIVKTPAHTYRVQQGPWSSQRQAKSARERLSKKGFEGSVKAS